MFYVQISVMVDPGSFSVGAGVGAVNDSLTIRIVGAMVSPIFDAVMEVEFCVFIIGISGVQIGTFGDGTGLLLAEPTLHEINATEISVSKVREVICRAIARVFDDISFDFFSGFGSRKGLAWFGAWVNCPGP